LSKLIPTDVGTNGTRYYEVSGLPGAPKEIPGIIRNVSRDWSVVGSDTKRIPQRPPKVGEAITVRTNAGSIRVRINKIRVDGAIMGVVDILNPIRERDTVINGIGNSDSVIVRGMDYVILVHTE